MSSELGSTFRCPHFRGLNSTMQYKEVFSIQGVGSAA